MKPFPSHTISKTLVATLGFAVPLAFTAAHWQHTSASSVACLAEMASGSSVSAIVGGGAVALVWIPVVLLALVFVALLVMLIAIQMLDRLIDDN